MNLLLTFCLCVVFGDNVQSRTYLASTARQLRDYLRIVGPGDTIQLRDGLYSGNFIANRIGRDSAPIKLIGTQRAVISNNRGTALYLTGRYWTLSGFTVGNSRRGIAVQNGKNNILEKLIIRDIEEEGLALRRDSDDNIIRNCFIIRTGLRLPQYGFGISIGSNEQQSYRGYVDRSDRNIIINNRFQTGSPAEAIHAYEGTCCGVIRENTFEGRSAPNVNIPQMFNRYWASIDGNRYRIERNIGRNVGIDGFRVRMSDALNGANDDNSRRQLSAQSADDKSNNSRDYYDSDDDLQDIEAQGCGNQFRGNRCEINSNGYCIRVINPNRCRVWVSPDNRVVGNTALTNVAVTNL